MIEMVSHPVLNEQWGVVMWFGSVCVPVMWHMSSVVEQVGLDISLAETSK